MMNKFDRFYVFMSDENEESPPDVVELGNTNEEQIVVFLCHYVPSDSSESWYWNAVDFVDNSSPVATISQPNPVPMSQDDDTIDFEDEEMQEKEQETSQQDPSNVELNEGKSQIKSN